MRKCKSKSLWLTVRTEWFEGFGNHLGTLDTVSLHWSCEQCIWSSMHLYSSFVADMFWWEQTVLPHQPSWGTKSVCVWQECWIARQVFRLERSWQQHLKRFLFVHSERSASIQPYILHPPLFFPRLLSLLLHPAKEENWTPTHVHTLSTHSWRT